MTTATVAAGVAWSAPWWLMIVVAAWRWRGSPSLDHEPRTVPEPAPRLSVIVPARDEALHIADCVRSILATEYPALDLLVVDDHSTDDTGARALKAAAGDSRFTLMSPPPLSTGWLGKQWACHHGSRVAVGSYLLFTDADVRHAPDLHARLLNACERENADLISVAGFQDTETFWERVVQPFVFSILAQWYGGAGAVNRSRNPRRKIANGQCLLFRRASYDAFGGHEAVRGKAAEDLAFAQQMTVADFRVHLTLGERQLSTRMYASLREIVAGWGKNIYAAGRETLPVGPIWDVLARMLVPAPALLALAPIVALLAGATGRMGHGTLAFGLSATLALLVWFVAIGRAFRIAPWYAVTFPLAAMVFLYIALGAVLRGERVRWKGRDYDLRAEA